MEATFPAVWGHTLGDTGMEYMLCALRRVTAGTFRRYELIAVKIFHFLAMAPSHFFPLERVNQSILTSGPYKLEEPNGMASTVVSNHVRKSRTGVYHL